MRKVKSSSVYKSKGFPSYETKKKNDTTERIFSEPSTSRSICSTNNSTNDSTNDSLNDSINYFDDSNITEQEYEWINKLSNASTVIEAMKQLYDSDKKIYYLYGTDILKMIEFRFTHNLDHS
jgi:DNA-directed RNA polymerase specialized sigma subunit